MYNRIIKYIACWLVSWIVSREQKFVKIHRFWLAFEPFEKRVEKKIHGQWLVDRLEKFFLKFMSKNVSKKKKNCKKFI